MEALAFVGLLCVVAGAFLLGAWLLGLLDRREG